MIYTSHTAVYIQDVKNWLSSSEVTGYTYIRLQKTLIQHSYLVCQVSNVMLSNHGLLATHAPICTCMVLSEFPAKIF